MASWPCSYLTESYAGIHVMFPILLSASHEGLDQISRGLAIKQQITDSPAKVVNCCMFCSTSAKHRHRGCHAYVVNEHWSFLP